MKWLMAAMALLLASLTVVVCDAPEEQREFTNDGRGGGDYEFKVPVPKGYDWEVSQSWAEHCEECDERYPVPPYDPPLYCASSHMDDCCKYGWDFNLTGNSDRGKPVLASSDGVVKSAGWSNGWGNTVLVDHGNETVGGIEVFVFGEASVFSVSLGKTGGYTQEDFDNFVGVYKSFKILE